MKLAICRNLMLRLLSLLCVALMLPGQIHAQSSVIDAKSSQTSLVDACEKQLWEQAHTLLEQGVKPDQSQPDGMTALHWAAFHNQGELAHKLIKAGANVNALTIYKVSPLSLACEFGNATVAVVLIQAKADTESKRNGNETPLMYAAKSGNVEIVKELLKANDKTDAKEKGEQTALMWAAAYGHLEVVDVLLKAGADFKHKTKSSGHSAITFAAREGRTSVVMRLLEAGIDIQDTIKPEKQFERGPREGMSIMMIAMESGHLELAIDLVKRGADVNDQRSGFTPLHAISWVRRTELGDDENGDPPPRITGKYSSLDFVRELVKLGADVNCVLKKDTPKVLRINTEGATPLLFAAKTADLQLIELLLELGADPQITNKDGTNVIMAAAGVGVVAVDEEPASEAEINTAIRLFVKLGIDINKVDANKETAMHGAALRTFPETVKCLAECGADPKIWNKKNKRGWTPLDIADGKRPGSVKPSPATRAALEKLLK